MDDLLDAIDVHDAPRVKALLVAGANPDIQVDEGPSS